LGIKSLQLYKDKEVYEKRWKASINTSDYDVLSFKEPKTQVQFFYQQFNLFIYNKLSRIYGNCSGKKMLEIGCGRATASIFLGKKMGLNIHLMDFSDAALAVARKNLEKYKIDAEIKQSDLFEMPYPVESFDIVISLGVMEHIERSLDAYREMYNLLKNGGVMFSMNVPEHPENIQRIAVPINKVLKNIESVFVENESKPWLDKRTMSKTADVYRSELSGEGFADIVRKAGFQAVEFVEINPLPTFNPLPKVIEIMVVKVYKIVLWIRKYVLGHKYPFACSPENSKEHFVVARKGEGLL